MATRVSRASPALRVRKSVEMVYRHRSTRGLTYITADAEWKANGAGDRQDMRGGEYRTAQRCFRRHMLRVTAEFVIMLEESAQVAQNACSAVAIPKFFVRSSVDAFHVKTTVLALAVLVGRPGEYLSVTMVTRINERHHGARLREATEVIHSAPAS